MRAAGGEQGDSAEGDGADGANLSGQDNFNAVNIEASTGEFWGVMGLTLNQNGYAWDFESALEDPAQTTGPASFSDQGTAFACHGSASSRFNRVNPM